MIESQNERKNDHTFIVTTYSDYNISKELIFLPICSILSLFFIYQKINDRVMVKWQGTLYPFYLYFITQFLKFFLNIIKNEKEDDQDFENLKSKKLNIQNIEKIILISNFFMLIDSALAIVALYYFGEFLDHRKDEFLFSSMYVLFSYCFSKIIYFILRKTKIFEIKRSTFSSDNSPSSTHGTLAFITSVTTPVLTYISNAMIICGSNGTCTQVYMSTIASLLGAFGVGLSDLSEYLFPVTIVLLGVSLFSLYIKKKSWKHKPFLIGVFSTVLILLSHIFDDTKLYYLIYPGNILMVIAAVWNARINKLYGLPRYIK